MIPKRINIPNEFTMELTRSKVLEEYKLTCLNYYTVKGVLPNVVQRQKILKRQCKQFGIEFQKLENDIIADKLSIMEQFNFNLSTFDLDIIDNYEKYLNYG